MKNILSKVLGTVANVAKSAAIMGAGSACLWIVHQPVVPQKVKELTK